VHKGLSIEINITGQGKQNVLSVKMDYRPFLKIIFKKGRVIFQIYFYVKEDKLNE
jgi:hypothetical protein